MRVLWVVLSLWACVMTRAKAQGQQVNGVDCSCTRPCETLVEAVDCNKVPRDDCPCCMICEQESKCSLDTDCPDSRFCLGGNCTDPCELLQPCKNTLKGGDCKVTNHRPTCVCKEGLIKNSDGSVCIPNEKNNTGCVNKGRLYKGDEVLYRDNCTEQCRCGTNGQFTCEKPACPPGLFLTGQHDHDELCIELRNRPGTDDCCVVVVCANSLSSQTPLTSPSKFPPIAAEESFDRANGIRALVGSTTTTKPVKPISEDEYKTNIKVLEAVLNSKVTKKPIYEDDTTVKPDIDGLKIKSTTEDKMEKITENPFDELMEKNEKPTEETTELNIEDQTELGSDIVTTMAPKDITMPAVVVEVDDFGNEVHKMTVHTEVEVVTPSSNILEEESATENIVHQSLDPSQQREPRKDEGDLNSTRDKSSDIKTNLEEKESIGKPSGTSLKTLVVTHNSTTLFLPSTKGGELFYKDAKSSISEWIRQEVEAGQDSTVLRSLMPSTHYTVKWSGQAGNSAKVNIETKDGCSKDGSSWAVGDNWTLGCQEKCRCRPGGKLECQPRCLFAPGSINDSLCTEKPTAEDPECCVVYDCRSPDDPEPVSSTPTLDSEPKLIVTTKSHNFITLAWENFSRSAEGVYFAEYRQSPKDGSSSNMSTEDSWQKTETTQGNQMPSITIDNLQPSTMYQVRISMIDNEQPGRIFATETISVKTEVGCMYASESHGVGEFMMGCEERCMCYANATVTCTQPCELPYFRTGSFANDSYCLEQRANPDDECCVLAICASEAGETEYEPCSNIVCGGNAECVSGVAPNEGDDVGYCRCKPGFIGDAKDLKTGCVKDSAAKELTCTFKNDTYKPGDVFDDSCDYKCSCSSNGELECQPRCEFPHANGAVTEAGCQYLPDPNDECCKLRVCNSTSEAATDAARAPLLPTDGCTFGNRTFAKDEKFSDGCEQNCTCMGYGDVSCFPRCPPVKVLPGAKCHTLPDPEDTCCSITVCADKPIDVMKANITGNLSNEEANKNMTEEELVHSHGNLTHSHPHTLGDNHTHEHEHAHEHEHEHMHGDVTHSHSHAHDDGNMTHTNEHEHMHGNMTHSHPHTPGNNHTHEELEHTHGNFTHSHPHIPGDNHTHEDDLIIMHGKEHTHEGVPHSHDHKHENEHTHVNMTHSHPLIPGDNHTHEVHEHLLSNMTHSHTHTPGDDQTHEEHEHTHGNMTHSHPHTHGNNHTHEELEHTHGNLTHSHPHILGDNHTHEDNMMFAHEHEHSHDNVTHTHPHIPWDDHTHEANETLAHDHEHTHDGVTHSHPHEHGVEHDHESDIAHMHEHVNDTQHEHMPGHDANENELGRNPRIDIPLHQLHIVEVEAINDTAVKIRVTVSDSVIEEILSSNSQFITVHYSRDSLMWMEKMISVSDISVENLNEILIVVNDLEPSTPYQFRVDFDGISSSTSKGGPMESPQGNFEPSFSPPLTFCPKKIRFIEENGTMHQYVCPKDTNICPEYENYSSQETCRLVDKLPEAPKLCMVGTYFTEEEECGRRCKCNMGGRVTCDNQCPIVKLPYYSKENCSLIESPLNQCCMVPECYLDLYVKQVQEKSMISTGNIWNLTDADENYKNNIEIPGNDLNTKSKIIPNIPDSTKNNKSYHNEFITKEDPHYHENEENIMNENFHNKATEIDPLLSDVDYATEDSTQFSYLPTEGKLSKTEVTGLSYLPSKAETGHNRTKIKENNKNATYLPEQKDKTSFYLPKYDDAENLNFVSNRNLTYLPSQADKSSDYLPKHEIQRISYLPKKEKNDNTDIYDDGEAFDLPMNSHDHFKNIGNKKDKSFQQELETNSTLDKTNTERPDSYDKESINISSSDLSLRNESYLDTRDGEKEEGFKDHKPVHQNSSTDSIPKDSGRSVDIDTSSVCEHNGEYYKIGEEFYEGCARYCFCGQNLEVHCAAIECPETFGLDVIDPDCLEWDREPDFVPTPPRCCGTVTCKVSAACQHEGQTFRNFDLLPTELTGCDKRCSCGYGNITCSDVCPPISDQPPANLQCRSGPPIKETMSGEYCCMEWKCPESSVAGPPGIEFPYPPVFTDVPRPFPQPVPDFGVSEPLVRPIDPNSVDFTFSIPPQYKGLPGDIIIRYIKTEDLPNSSDPKTWLKQEVGTEGFISKVTWAYVMENLDAGSHYSMQLVLQPYGIDPVTSPIFVVTTQLPVTTVSSTSPLPFLEVDAELHASQLSSSDAKITWRKFSDQELQYIDGFQIKYTAEGKLMPKFSQYFHRDNHMIMLRDLEPGTNYTVDLVFLEQGPTPVYNTRNITFETLRVEDPYAFDITAETGKIDAQTATVYYSGVPEPEEKYVNIYRAIYIFDNGQIDDQSFKIPKVGDEKQIFLNNLKQDTEYQVWIEAYLANGRKKKSNVITIKTKAGELPKPVPVSEVNPIVGGSDDYYGALVAVAIIAAIACLGFLGLLVILMRRNNHGNATINSPRSDAAYDNPSYKVGDNTYDMEMNGINGKNGNGAAHIDDP